jgi:FMN-dependent NADH-azoreductase
MSRRILHIDASARQNGSISREITNYLSSELKNETDREIIYRDLSKSELPLVTEQHIEAYYTPKQDRTEEQKSLLAISDGLIDELKAVDTLVIGAPIYNFSVPAALKAWIDLVCRVGETFVYTDTGPKGLLDIDKAYIVVAAGGVAIGSDVDFNSNYLKQICRFIGVKESVIIDASGSKQNPEDLIEQGKQQANNLVKELSAA